MAEPLVFVPGLMADARLFLPQMVALGTRFSVQVCLPTQGDTVEENSQYVLDQAPAKFALIGHGLGGAVALDVLRRAAERVSRVVLISTPPLSETPQAAAAREARIVAARSGRLPEAMAEEIPAEALAATEWRGEVLALLRDMAMGLGEGVFLRQSRALQRRPDQQKTMRRIKIPALIRYISTFTELVPGDVIVSGTPGGVGAKRNPPLWMAPGDTVEIEVDKIGVLKNTIAQD